MNLNLTYTNGIRVEVSDPLNLGPIVGYDEALTAIAGLLDDAKSDLSGADVSFPLGSGFAGFSDAAGFTKVNRALAARVAVYRKQWSAALTDLNESFLDLTGNFNTGVSEVFGTGSGDQLNPAFFENAGFCFLEGGFSCGVPKENRSGVGIPRVFKVEDVVEGFVEGGGDAAADSAFEIESSEEDEDFEIV